MSFLCRNIILCRWNNITHNLLNNEITASVWRHFIQCASSSGSWDGWVTESRDTRLHSAHILATEQSGLESHGLHCVVSDARKKSTSFSNYAWLFNWWRQKLGCLYPPGWITVIHWSIAWHSATQAAICIECHHMTDLWHSTPRPHHSGITQAPLAAHQRVCYVQGGTPGSPVAVWAGTCLPGRWLLPRVWHYSTLSAVSWRPDLRGTTNIQQLWQQTELLQVLEFVCATLYRSNCAIQMTVEGTSFQRSTNMVLCDFNTRCLRKTVTYLLNTYLLTYLLILLIAIIEIFARSCFSF